MKGFLSVVICGPLEPEQVVPMLRAMRERWPFLRLPAHADHRRHVMLASFARKTIARETRDLGAFLDEMLAADLPEFTEGFPHVTFALLRYSWPAQIWRAGERVQLGFLTLLRSGLSTPAGLRAVEFEDAFEGFEPGYFGPEVDPRYFIDCVPQGQRAEFIDEKPPLDMPPLADMLADIQRRTRVGPVEREIMAVLDRDPESLEVLHVLADARMLAGDSRGELLGRELIEREAGRIPEPLVETAIERDLANLATADPPHHFVFGDWHPRLWVQMRGPWLIRLVVRTALANPYEGKAAVFDEWQPYGRPTFVFESLRRLLELPCSRFLSEPRITLLACPIQPDLSGRDFSGFDFSGLNFQRAKLHEARFDRANLSRVSASQAELPGASLVEANLEDADLQFADLSDADLRNANLAGTDLRCADLRGARLDGAEVAGVNFKGARI